MHIFIIALYLLHGCYHSTGHPVLQNDTLNFVPSALQHLANTCENHFLADTIKKMGENCKINDTMTSQSELECFMFYDINSQLCESFRHSEFNLQENYNTKIKESQNVTLLCDHAKTWKLAAIQKHPIYTVLKKMFSVKGKCQQLCAVTDILSDDANYYCAYFKWGTDVIQSQGQVLSLQNKDVVVPASDTVPNQTEDGAALSLMKNTNVSVATNKSVVKPVETKLPINTVETNLLAKSDQFIKEEVNSDTLGQKTELTSTTNRTSDIVEKTSEVSKSPNIAEHSVPSVGSTSVKEDEKVVPVEEEPPRKDEIEKKGQLPEESKEILIDSKDKLMESNPEDDENDNDDYGPADDLHAEGGNKNENGVVESDPDVALKDHDNAKVGIESITHNNGNTPRRVADMFPNPIQESFTDDDDHFFPIFLTGIIIVVLVYILYHNKSKFTKVILGLIVEGRQSGRRRNSRGHAYRRLDTLEQAMSSNTAAPPSKIIY